MWFFCAACLSYLFHKLILLGAHPNSAYLCLGCSHAKSFLIICGWGGALEGQWMEIRRDKKQIMSWWELVKLRSGLAGELGSWRVVGLRSWELGELKSLELGSWGDGELES